MKINSIKLTISDAKTADNKDVAAIMGTIFVDNDEYKEDLNGFVLDGDGDKIPMYETINFTTAVDHVTGFKSMLQQMVVEALTLNNMEIAEKNGTLSHFIKSVGVEPETPTAKVKASDTKVKPKKPGTLKRSTKPRKIKK